MRFSINPYKLMTWAYLWSCAISYVLAPYLLSSLPGSYDLPAGYLSYSCFFCAVSTAGLLLFNFVVRFRSSFLYSGDEKSDSRSTRLYCYLLCTYLVAWIAGGGLTAREEIGTLVQSGSLFYIVRSVEVVPLLAFCRIADSLLGEPRPWATKRALLCLISALILVSAGGRGFLIEWGIALLILSFFKFKRFPRRRLLIIYGLCVTVIFGAVGMLRAEQATYEGGQAQVFGLSTLDRVGEYATVMQFPRIDAMAGTEGFARFDRLTKIWLPAFLASDKKTLNDGSETIATISGLGDGNFVLFPLLFDLDLLLRFGKSGLLAAPFLVAGFVTFSAFFIRFTRKLAPPRYLFIVFFLPFTKIYSASVLGAINLFLYKSVRDALIIFAIGAVVQYYAKGRKSRFVRSRYGRSEAKSYNLNTNNNDYDLSRKNLK